MHAAIVRIDAMENIQFLFIFLTPCFRVNHMVPVSYTHLLTHGKRAADTIRYNQLLVIWDPRPRTNIRQVSWLIIPHTKQPSQFPSGCKNTKCFVLLKYSDEIVQDSHLLPF